MEEPLRLEPQAYDATIGPAGRGSATRLAAVCAALVSLLAVCCVVLASGGSALPSQRGLPGFELSLNSAMETFFKNTAAREQQEAAAQQLSVRGLNVALAKVAHKHLQDLAVAPNPLYASTLDSTTLGAGISDTIDKLNSQVGAMKAMTSAVEGGHQEVPKLIAVKKPAAQPVSHHVAPQPVARYQVPTSAATDYVPAGMPTAYLPDCPGGGCYEPKKAAHTEEASHYQAASHYTGSYLNPPAERAPGGNAPGVVSGATAAVLNNLQNVEGAVREMPKSVKHPVVEKAKTQGLAEFKWPGAKRAGLDNIPWSAPASDYPALKRALTKTSILSSAPKSTDFDVSVPKGLRSGQSFLAQIPGHREREVTVPSGVKAGQLVSINVPATTKLQTKTQLDGEEPAAEEEAVVSEEAKAESAEAAGEGATVEAAGGEAQDYATVPVEFGTTPEQQAAAQAVNDVHDMFRKEEAVTTKWIPGDTQPIPALEPLGQTSTDKWTSAPELYGDQTDIHGQSCAARCSKCKTMGAGNWYCQKCSDVCEQLSDAESKLSSYTWKVGDPMGIINPAAQAEMPRKYFRAIEQEGKWQDNRNLARKREQIPAKKRWYQETTQVTHFNPGGISQITSNPKWPVQAKPAGLSALATLYKPDGVLPSNLPTMSSLATVEGRAYKHSLILARQNKALAKQQALEEEAPAGEEAPAEEEVAGGEEAEGEAADGGEEGAVPEKTAGFIVATPDDQGLEHGAVARKMTTNVNIIGPGGPSYVQIHTVPAENPQHFGAYAKPNFRSEYPTTQTITVNPTRPVVRMVAQVQAPQIVSSQPVMVAPRPGTSMVKTYQPAAMAAKQQTIQTTMAGGGLMFQVPAAPGMALAPGASYSHTTTVNRVQPQWGAPSVSATTVTTAQGGAPVQYVQAPAPQVQYVQQPQPAVQYVQQVLPIQRMVQSAKRLVGQPGTTVQVVRKESTPKYQSLSPIPSLAPMSFFDKKKRARQALFRHWDGHEMKVLNVLPEKADGAINLDPQNWQGQNMVISEGAQGSAADAQFSEAMAQVREGLHAAANSELHYKGKDRSDVNYREYGDVNPAIGEPVDPTKGGPKLITSDPFGLRPKEAVSPLDSINERAGAVPTGSKTESMVVQVPAGLKAGQQFTALTGAGHEEEVTVPQGVKAGGEVEINVPTA